MLSVLRSLRSWIARFSHNHYYVLGLPTRRFVQVNIETNRICNRACHFCLYGVREKLPAQPMPASLFFRIIDQLHAIKFTGRLSLFSTNEPLTDKRINQFIRYAALLLPNCWHTLATNGDLLNQERLDQLFHSGLDLLWLNSYDAQAVQRNAALYQYGFSRYPDKIMHHDRTVYTGWVSRAGHIPEYATAPAKGFCDLPNYALYIDSLGQVLACCHDFDAKNHMGDLTKDTIQAVWTGAPFEKLRRDLNRGDRSGSALCAQCDRAADFAQFLWNVEQPRLNGKCRWFAQAPSAAELSEAEAIKARLLAREQRSFRNH